VPKPSKAEHTIRITKIIELLTLGLSRAEIIRYDSEKTKWGVTTRTIDNYIALATEAIEAQSETKREYEIGKALERLESLYQRNMSIQDFKAALAVVKERSELLGLKAPNKHEIDTKGENIIKVEITPRNDNDTNT